MNENKNRLLFITQKIHQDDDDLAFVISWVDEFIKQRMEVRVICLERRSFDDHFPVYSLGKERGLPKWRWIINFYKLIFSLSYDRVFVHMNPEWSALGGWYWRIRGIPFYLWYTHYSMSWYLRITGWLVNKMFCATYQSLPQYDKSKKKIVTGHGIDIGFWFNKNKASEDAYVNLLSVHRLCRSKRLELAIEALKFLPEEYTLTHYGPIVDKWYYQELLELVKINNLENRVTFKGAVPMFVLRDIYPHYKVMVNMAKETIDKTMLEGMCNGVFPVTTKRNATAIGILDAPEEDTPKAIADFILLGKIKKYNQSILFQIVESRHNLSKLVHKIINHF